jgi:hypothetical protein
MATPTDDDVVVAFDSLGGQVVQPMALRIALEERGFDASATTNAVNQAIANGVLGSTPSGGFFVKTRV